MRGQLVIELDIIEWAEARGIFTSSRPKDQTLKTAEEFGELAKAVNHDDLPAIIDGIGDVAVTLIILAKMYDLSLIDCLEHAYDEIRDRKGTIHNGVFKKEGGK